MEEKREIAKQKISNAKYLENLSAAKKKIIAEYQEGINLLTEIFSKNPDDIKEIVRAHYNIATLYFNSHEYINAGQHYLAAINELQQNPLNDDSYRNLTELFIDLADACYEMKNQMAGDEAMTNAIKAFGLIRDKTLKERQIGDPVVHFKEFHAYYEKKLSTMSYLKSATYINHEHLLADAQVARLQEEELFNGFESLSIGEIQQIDLSLENMLSQLSLKAEPRFAAVSLSQTPTDSAYRTMAMQFLNLAKSYIQNKQIPNSITAYRQSIETLKKIKQPEESDMQIIQSLNQQIEFLSKKPRSTMAQISKSTSQGTQRTVPITDSGLSFFAQEVPRTSQQAPYFSQTDESDFDENMTF